MKPTNIEDMYNLSPAQEGILFHSLYQPEAPDYFLELEFVMKGGLHHHAFEQAWRQLLDKHSVLRTSFHWDNISTPVQLVQREVELPLEYLDWTSIDAETRNVKLEGYREESRKRGFDFTKAPILRMALIRLEDKVWQFIWHSHHLVLDGWSTSLLFSQFFHLYHSLIESKQFHIESYRPFGDYIEWVRKQDLVKAEAYWKRTLAEFGSPVPLMEYIKSGTQPAARFEKQSVELSADSSIQLQALVQKQHLTLNTVALGAWALLLSRYSGEKDIVFGASLSGRSGPLTAIQKAVGMFINTLPVRICVSEEATLIPWLKTIQEHFTELLQYEYTPLLQIQQWCGLPKSTPLFHSILAFENYPMDKQWIQSGGDYDISDFRFEQQTNYPLNVIIIPPAGSTAATVQIHYQSVYFDSSTIASMLGHLKTILEQFSVRPSCRLQEISMLNVVEQETIVSNWSRNPHPSQVVADEGEGVIQRFERYAGQNPERIATVYDGMEMTYRQLNNRADMLAYRLRKHGISPGTMVGVYLERSPDWIIAMLSVWKAGGIYLPLDPRIPEERMNFILHETKTALVITQEQLPNRMPPSVTGLRLDAFAKQEEMVTNLPGPGELAYCIFTSGSTGVPKGVLLSHRGLGNVVRLQKEIFKVTAEDRVAQLASIGFDASVFEVGMALGNGAALCLPTREESMPGPRMSGLLQEQKITVMTITPSGLSALPYSDLPHLRIINTAGESCDQKWVELWGTGRIFNNLYGPTEAGIWATWHTCGQVGRKPAIGRPIPNTQVYILDENLCPVPAGVPGELYIGGCGLARGYLNDPYHTAASFIPHPFSGQPGERLYRTGDIGKFLADGNIDFIGRTDQQIKLRGFRIEPGEIEAVLTGNQDIKEAVVLLRKGEREARRLTAYVVPQVGSELSSKDCYDYLSDKLPDFMIPSAFMLMKELPVTVNGKLDHQALPSPAENWGGEEVKVLPRTPTESALALIWEELLELDSVGVYDNFFEKGGHSLLAVQLSSRIKETFRVELPLRYIFEAPTIDKLGYAIVREQAELQQEDGDLEKWLDELEQLSDEEARIRMNAL